MDTDLLKTFLEVSRTRHFGKAAENLYLTRSAVSFRIKQLENILGIALFERLRNNIQPTPAGERMLGHAEAVLNAWERAKQDIILNQQHSAQLALSAGDNIWDAFLQGLLQPLHLRLEGVALRTDVLPALVMTRQLIERTLDIAITFDPPKLDGVTLVKLAQIKLYLVSKQQGITLDQTPSLPYIKVDWGTAFNITHAQDFTMLPLPVLHTSSARMALDFILNNGGCAFLPEALIRPFLDNGTLYNVDDAPCIYRHVYAAYWAKNERISYIEQAISILKTDKCAD
ncbi:MAG: LysR family transcriptional regulator [Shewanella psychromarinicola]|jgi:DNA-binding transcriptional LysR family regulator|uniref:LysR family transcriptional regulator n=1 Tax=Shewanella psychromarinicola TaxID=2487742 RepID=A0A3N4DNX8_9GAMM|nr:LysR family transcriptional regulator [Shewanella psychromarinicola]AZG35849.1 LysR family transcriptional regulator [Shewanella psychromarinicola]MCL1082674.1 LysR family transcriptional regulator [Shewanella psychromarinicola]RPA23791.1 LysR family transcriptional regulator [Shewanella psychromarinicola]